MSQSTSEGNSSPILEGRARTISYHLCAKGTRTTDDSKATEMMDNQMHLLNVSLLFQR